MARIDYSKPAEICWANRPYWDEPGGSLVEEYFEDFTLREAVLFAMGHLDSRHCKSVTVKCDGRVYNMVEIEELFRSRYFPLDEPLRDNAGTVLR
jgi:hypothetical protein